MKLLPVLIVTLVLLSACGVDEPVLIYQDRNALQCESSGISPADSASKLSAMNIEVLDTYCGQRTGIAYPAACGMGTGAILIHQVAQADLDGARQAGFEPVAALVNLEQGTGYEFVECEQP